MYSEGPHKGSETSKIPGLADQGPILGGGTSEHSDCGRPYAALRVDNQSKEVRTQTHSGFFYVCGLRIPPRFRPFKTHSREMAQTLRFDPMLKASFDYKMLMSLIGLLDSTEKMVPKGLLHKRPF